MKVNNKTVPRPSTVPFKFYRGGDEFIINITPLVEIDIDDVLPVPQPPTMKLVGGGKSTNTEDPEYLTALEEYSERRTNYSLWKSITHAGDVVFESFDAQDPETWNNLTEELDKTLTGVEVNRLFKTINQANDPQKIAEESMDIFSDAHGESTDG